MLTVRGHHLGDSWFFVDGEEAHCFFLICPEDTPRHMAWDIGHASSRDLRSWTYHRIVLRRGPADAWDGLCLATGTVVRHAGRYWMAYTGNWFGPVPAVGLAHSESLADWSKFDHNPVTTIDEHHYTAHSRGSRSFPHWRDPFLFRADGWVYQLVCATAANQQHAAGTIGAARSRDMLKWELLAALDVDPFAEELECPQVVTAGDRSYLVFSTHSDLLLDRTSGQTGGNMYCMVGTNPLGPFRVENPLPILPDEMTERPYAGRVVWFHERPYLLGTIWRDAGDAISDPIPLRFTASGVVAA